MAAIQLQPSLASSAPRATSRRGVLTWTLRAIAIVLAIWIAASFIGEQVSLHPERSAPRQTPDQWGMAYRDVSFRTVDGLTLRGWWIPGDAHATVVMIHGLGSNRDEPLGKSAYLHQAGYNLLVFDLRGHGLSDGEGTMGYREPADAAAAVAEAHRLDPGPIALFGYSLGAAIAVEEAAVNPDVSAVIEDSGFSSVGDVVLARFNYITHLPDLPFAGAVVASTAIDLGTSPWNVQPAVMAARIHKPLLAIVGGRDTMVPPAEGLAIYRAAAGPKQLLYVPGTGHVQAYYAANRLYETTVLAFLASSLKNPTT
ncbi:MAG TPA: alpha/beta hydrolase [Candidatus Dormibacteraeota bacterium]|nr:alpha/beta hydrolase [Candidatus Dormibacteraeota bacterium]